MKKRIALLTVAVATALLSISAGAAAQTAKVAEDPPAPRPDAPSEPGFQVGLYGFGSELTLNNSMHSVGGGEPDPLKHAQMRFVGQGWMPGAELRVAVLPRDYFGRFRVGFGIGVGGATGFHVPSDPLAAGVSYKASSLWGARFSGFLGQQFEIGDVLDAEGHRHPLFAPYFDIMAVGDITEATIDLHVKRLGMVGESTFDAYAFTLAPRAGVIIPLMPNLALDIGGSKSVYGAERYGGYAGLTVYGP